MTWAIVRFGAGQGKPCMTNMGAKRTDSSSWPNSASPRVAAWERRQLGATPFAYQNTPHVLARAHFLKSCGKVYEIPPQSRYS